MSIIGHLLSDLFGAGRKHNSTAIDTIAVSNRSRYLKLLMDTLLNEPYLENEVRLLYIFSQLAAGKPIDTDVMRQINQRMPKWVEAARAARQDGSVWWRVAIEKAGVTENIDFRDVCQFSHTMVGRKRMQNISQCLDIIRLDRVPGDLAETGAWRGGACIFMRGYLAAWDMKDRTVWVADSFEGLPKPALPQDAGYDFSVEQVPILAVTLQEVQENFRRYGLLDEQVRFLKGWFRDTLPASGIEQLALLRLDGDLYESTMDALNALYHKVSAGGFVIVDDFGDFEPCRRAIHEFRGRQGITEPIVPIDWTGAYWRKAS
jgi:O-methyltransferase